MRIAYLILVHSMPDHLGRLIAALSDEHADFFVHVNNKVSIEPFLIHQAPNVYFIDRRVSVHWGESQLIEAAIYLIQSALSNNREYGYLVLLSGSCYPIRSKEYIRRLFIERRGDEFMNVVKMPNAEAQKSLSRLDRFYMRSDQSRLEFVRRVASGFWVRRKSGRLFSKKWWLSRDWCAALGPLVPYGGSFWWALTTEACRYIDAFVKREHDIVRFFENTQMPDEMFFQTILANSAFAPHLRRNLTYTDWTAGGSRPGELTEGHVRMFAQQWPLMGDGVYGKGELCFARKFPDDGGRLADLVDKLVRQRDTGKSRVDAAHSEQRGVLTL
jgi:hypothetical protein